MNIKQKAQYILLADFSLASNFCWLKIYQPAFS
jgi:hypothetical protein